MVLASEFQDLIGAYVDNLYQPAEGEFMIKLNSRELGKRFLRLRVGKWIWVEKECDDRAQSQFSNALKKHISNGRITGLEQLEFERILKITIQKKEEYELFIEFISPGNVILVKEGTIIKSYSDRKWRDREIRAGQPYKPPTPRINVPLLKRNDLIDRLKGSEKDLVRALATDLNLGGLYAEEVCLRAGLDKKMKAADLGEDELKRAHEGFKDVLSDFKEKVSPLLISEGSEAVDLVPIRLKKYEGLDAKEFGNLNEAVIAFLDEIGVEEETVEDSGKKKIARMLKSQKEAVVKWNNVIDRSKRSADAIYQHYEEIDLILKQVKTDRTYSSPNLKDFDPKDNVAILDFEGEEIRLDIYKSIHENAQVYYEKIKKAKAKLKSIETALKKSEKQLASASKRSEHAKAKGRLPKPRKKKLWFERFKWFISSEGFVVIGGRDSKSNEHVFRKHLKDGDRYVHADIQGAPSVVVKEGAKASEVTLKEACQFSLAHSKAWNAKLTSGSAYWVNPEQVSKTPEAGEYLAKGSFMVRGKRNHFRNLELVLAIGEVEHSGEVLLMCGPRSAVEKSAKRYIVFRQGETRKNDFAKQLARDFGVSVDDVAPILPPGDVEVLERKGM
jgi:predicted ribosome quality control (RQC) complex YloA/Tae2 family protein